MKKSLFQKIDNNSLLQPNQIDYIDCEHNESDSLFVSETNSKSSRQPKSPRTSSRNFRNTPTSQLHFNTNSKDKIKFEKIVFTNGISKGEDIQGYIILTLQKSFLLKSLHLNLSSVI